MTPHDALQQLRDLDRTSPEFHEQLSNLYREDAYRNTLTDLESEDLTWLIEYLGGVLADISDHGKSVFQETLRELKRICGIKEVLPKSCTFAESLLGCVYEGTLNGSKVRIRRIRIGPEQDSRKVKETFHQVAVLSKYLAHPNILPLLCVATDPLELISEWMPGGDLTGYLANNPNADKFSLLSDVAEGLNYLHSCDVTHGDLKGANILVAATGCARLADFGLVAFTQDLDSIRNASAEHQSLRWIAPEILDHRETYSKEADIFSLAGVSIELFTGAAPFSGGPLREAVSAIVGGGRPPRPSHSSFTDELWALTQRCWHQEPRLRPTASEVLRGLDIPVWKRVISIDRHLSTDDRVSLTTAIFSNRDETEAVKLLSGEDAQSFIDAIDQTLDALVPWLRKKCLTTLCKICGRRGMLPRSLHIPLCYNRLDPPLYNGGYAEVWKGKHQGREVAVKVLKVYLTSDFDEITRRFCKEVMTWKTLRHQNLLPLLGVTMNNNQFAMVSEWMINGNINEFIEEHGDVNRFELLKDIARGLIYMHGEGIVHGDLKGANVLIDRHGHACLADFGLIMIISDSTNSTSSLSYKNAGTTRWMSSELLDPDHLNFEDGRPTKESDCYALGMVILEVLSGQVPFAGYRNIIVMQKIVRGEHPERPKGVWFTDYLWQTLEQCWSPLPSDRHSIGAILECLEQVSIGWKPLLPLTGENIQIGDDDESPFMYLDLPQAIPSGGDRSPALLRSLSPGIPRQVVVHSEAPWRLAKYWNECPSLDSNAILSATPGAMRLLETIDDANGQGTSTRGPATATEVVYQPNPVISSWLDGSFPYKFTKKRLRSPKHQQTLDLKLPDERYFTGDWATGTSNPSLGGTAAQVQRGHNTTDDGYAQSISSTPHYSTRPRSTLRLSATSSNLSGSAVRTQNQLTYSEGERRQIMIPQDRYVPWYWHHRVEPKPEDRATFRCLFGGDGIMLDDALRGNFEHLIGRDDPMFADYMGYSMNLRICWPGYKPWTNLIVVVDHTPRRNPVTKTEFVLRVAKVVQRFIENNASEPITPGCERWKVGPGFIEIKDIVLAAVVRVSMASQQPELLVYE